VGLSAVPAKLPDSNFNESSGTAWYHLVADNRGAVLSGLGFSRSSALLLFRSGAAHCYRSDLCFSSAALLFVIALGSSFAGGTPLRLYPGTFSRSSSSG